MINLSKLLFTHYSFTLFCKQYAMAIHQFSPCLGSFCDTYLQLRSTDHKNDQLCSDTLQFETWEVNFMKYHKISAQIASFCTISQARTNINIRRKESYKFLLVFMFLNAFTAFLSFITCSSRNYFTVMSLLLAQRKIQSPPTSIGSKMVSRNCF